MQHCHYNMLSHATHNKTRTQIIFLNKNTKYNKTATGVGHGSDVELKIPHHALGVISVKPIESASARYD